MASWSIPFIIFQVQLLKLSLDAVKLIIMEFLGINNLNLLGRDFFENKNIVLEKVITRIQNLKIMGVYCERYNLKTYFSKQQTVLKSVYIKRFK